MSTKLERYKVYNFRSIEESDWIEIADNSCLVGTNEAGKTNLLIALWKLNPANNEPIVPLDDFPRHLYSNYKAEKHSEDIFISADFILDDDIQEEFSSVLKCDIEQIKTVLVSRRYNGNYDITFPYSQIESFSSTRIISLIDEFKTELDNNENYLKESEELKIIISNYFDELKKGLKDESVLKSDIEELISKTNILIEKHFGKKKNLPELFKLKFINKLQFFINAFEGKTIVPTQEISSKVLKVIPKFVYYSDYGNLDSEIFLPRVIEDFERDDLSESARAKARTLDVLFKYVKLSPKEIFELGNDQKVIVKTLNYNNAEISSVEQKLTDEEIREWADKKRERGILLRSAATQLTQSFRKWWLQGNYVFDFEADGNHFRINVSDTLRPEPIELEARSRGLQWFFSFFLVFFSGNKRRAFKHGFIT